MSVTSRRIFRNNLYALCMQGILHIRGGDDMLDDKRYDYDNETHKGVDSADELAIILALRNGEKLVIDRNGHIYDSAGRWIADEMMRSSKNSFGIEL